MPENKVEKGFECKDCGCRHFRVQGTRVANKQIIRYRLCRNCGNG
jgi:transcription elongation factor Elf1